MNNVQFTKYDDAGRILFHGEVPEDMLALQGDNVVVGLADAATEWFDHGTRQPRPVLAITLDRTDVTADGTDAATLTGVPKGVMITVTGPNTVSGESDGSDVHLTFALPGTYTITAEQFPYQTFKAEIHAA